MDKSPKEKFNTKLQSKWKNFTPFIESQHALLYSQEPVNGPYPDPVIFQDGMQNFDDVTWRKDVTLKTYTQMEGCVLDSYGAG
jgi:hypothetical protein